MPKRKQRRRDSIYSAPHTEQALAAYHNDKRWADATKPIERCRFDLANVLVLDIMQDHGCI